MGISNIIYLLGGLGLFLFGMKYMSEAINQVAGNKMKSLLEKLTSNRFKGFFLGVIVTVIIQSSSATTVMLMGFLNAGIMTLAQATGVITGANLGTTVRLWRCFPKNSTANISGRLYSASVFCSSVLRL